MKTHISVKFQFNEKKYNLKAIFELTPEKEVLFYKSDLYNIADVWFDDESDEIDAFSCTWYDSEDDDLAFEVHFKGTPISEDAEVSHIIAHEIYSGNTIEEINPNYGDIIKASIKIK